MTTFNQSQPRRSWQPDGDAHLIFQWVKMEGKSQGWVASAFGINQSTVSRIIQRYERWQAHAKERENGRLDHAERLRAQRWLTFERNELIVASCMRIANELEGSIDTSRSTIRRAASDPSQEIEVRTHHACIDRTGMCSRFLRLAHRINMENLKLAALDPPPLATPLSPAELAEEEAQAAADAAELAAARVRNGASSWEGEAPAEPPPEPDDLPPATAQQELRPPDPPAHTHHSPAPLHNLHNENAPDIAATTAEPCTCILQASINKNAPGVCITGGDSSPPPGENAAHAAETCEPTPAAT